MKIKWEIEPKTGEPCNRWQLTIYTWRAGRFGGHPNYYATYPDDYTVHKSVDAAMAYRDKVIVKLRLEKEESERRIQLTQAGEVEI